nr:hypothetical protein [Tanacetum cinerariifolium]
EETPSLDNILTLLNRFEEILGATTNSDESNGVKADVSNLETSITASPTPTLKIYRNHPKSQNIGPVDTPIQTRNKSKEAIEKGDGPNWLFDIDSLTNSMNYVPVVDAGTNSTNFSCTKDGAGQEVKKDVSTLRYITLPNWGHDDFLESFSSKSQDACNSDVPKSSGNSNPTTTLIIPSADQIETLTVESPIPTASSPVLTACFTDSQEPSSETRLISKRVTNQEETPSLDNILTLLNRFEEILGATTNSDESNGVKADVSNLETSITASPTPTLKIYRNHPKSQNIGP